MAARRRSRSLAPPSAPAVARRGPRRPALLLIAGVAVLAVVSVTTLAWLLHVEDAPGSRKRFRRGHGARPGPDVTPFGAAQPFSAVKVDLASELFPGSLALQQAGEPFDVLVVGAGLSGAVLADLYARVHNKRVLVLERRPHIAGNCFDAREKRSDILVSLYGAHLFHTNKEAVWHYVHRFGEWVPYEHRVVGRVDGSLVPIPVNIDTVNMLLGLDIRSVEDMEAWLENERAGADPDSQQSNSEEVGIARVGKRLFDKIFSEYTQKQWGVSAAELGPEVLSRIPVRADWDDRYFPHDRFQALPAQGYTKWFEQLFDHPNIVVYTSTDFFTAKDTPLMRSQRFEKTFFTGQIDQFFRHKGVDLAPLQYRSIRFETTVTEGSSVAQPNGVVNYPQFRDGGFTRAIEYKHLFHQSSRKTVVVREFSMDVADGQEPYYPFPTEENQKQFKRYQDLAVAEEASNQVYFVGRLANYKYFNMDDAINNAMELYVRLEGRRGLDAALAEGRSKVDDVERHRVHLVIHLGPGQDLALLRNICAGMPANLAMSFKVFVYSVDGRAKSFLETARRSLERQAPCLGPLQEEQSLFVRQVGRSLPELVFVEHMIQNGFEFGDVTVFLSSEDGRGVAAAVGTAVSAQLVGLGEKLALRASQPGAARRDIRRLPAGTFDAKARWSLHDLTRAGAAGNVLHVLPLEGLERSAASLGPLGGHADLRGCPIQARSRSFAVSEAALRRALVRHRDVMHNIFLPALRAEDVAVARDLRAAWLCLFWDRD